MGKMDKTIMKKELEKLILIDGNALFYRAFHAIPPFHTSRGELTNAIYGFMSMILTLLMKEHPDYIAIAWDSRAQTYRHKEFAGYKATRPPPPPGMYEQLPKLKTLLDAFAIPMYAMDGYEADDLLATICEKLKEKLQEKNLKILIASGDRDLFQIVTDEIHILVPEFGFQKYEIYTPEKVAEKLHVHPSQIVDYKSLVGDNSDNIPGVKGIGPAGACELLGKYRTLENIYEHLEEISPKIRAKLEIGKESAFFSKKMVTLQKDSPINIDLQNCKTYTFNIPQIENIFHELEFRSLFKKLHELEKFYNKKRQESQNYALPLSFE